jgi:hypothetical protein
MEGKTEAMEVIKYKKEKQRKQTVQRKKKSK